MKLLILGAGSVGLGIAARLSNFCDLHALCRQRHADVIVREGFSLSGIWGEGRYRFSASESVPQEHFDYCLITSKSLHTRGICERHSAVLANSEVVSLQNGIGNEEIISEYTDRVIGGTIITGFEWRGEARVQVTVEAGPIRLGRFPEGMDPGVERLVELFRRAGLNVEESDNIRANLWAKTLYNCALNPLGAIMDVAYGELGHAAAWRIIERLIEEAFAVCQAEGVILPWREASEYLDYLRDIQIPATASHNSSMLQDIRNGRETEIDFMNGAVTRLAKKHGVPVPNNRLLVDMIRFKTALGSREG